MKSIQKRLDIFGVYKKLLRVYGEQGWWPLYVPTSVGTTRGKPHQAQKDNHHGLTYGIPYNKLKEYHTPFRDPYFEIALGAILTQNVAWQNVAQAISGLYSARALTPERLLKLPIKKLEKILVPTRYYVQKTKAVRLFSKWLIDNYNGDILNILTLPLLGGEQKRGYMAHLAKLRAQLLHQWGIGPETADSIMLYALNLPIFVVDIYTKRLCEKFGVKFNKYEEYQNFFENKLRVYRRNHRRLSASTLYQEYHALIVASGKENHQKIM